MILFVKKRALLKPPPSPFSLTHSPFHILPYFGHRFILDRWLWSFTRNGSQQLLLLQREVCSNSMDCSRGTIFVITLFSSCLISHSKKYHDPPPPPPPPDVPHPVSVYSCEFASLSLNLSVYQSSVPFSLVSLSLSLSLSLSFLSISPSPFLLVFMDLCNVRISLHSWLFIYILNLLRWCVCL